MKDNYYHILGLDNFASPQEIKSAYRNLAKKYHPDKNLGNPQYEEKFKRISLAYQILTSAEEKYKFDLSLTQDAHYQAPRYKARESYYTTEKARYTPTAWMLARIFIIVLISAAILIPIGLLYFSSISAYNKGMAAMQQSEYDAALNHFNRAITSFGGKSADAAIQGSIISIYFQQDYEQAEYFIDKGLEHAEKKIDFGQLFYLKALAVQESNYPDALQYLDRSDSLGYHADSIQFRKGMINAFKSGNYKEAVDNFDFLISHEVHPAIAWFGKAWAQQNLHKYEEATRGFSRVIEINATDALAHYYRGMNYIHLTDSAHACADFKIAMDLGLSQSRQAYRYHCVRDSVNEKGPSIN